MGSLICSVSDSNKKFALFVFTKSLVTIIKESLLFLKGTDNPTIMEDGKIIEKISTEGYKHQKLLSTKYKIPQL